MAVNNTTGSFASMEFPMAFSRQDGFPLDKTSVYGSYEKAHTYAKTSPLAYVGQVLAVVENYQIKNTAGDLEPLGTGDLAGDVDALLAAQRATDEEIQAAISEVYPEN